MSETQNNTVVAAFLAATGNAGLTNTRRVEIGGSSAEIDFGKFLKSATQINDSKERICQAEKPDYREPGRTSTTSEPSFKTNQDFKKPKSVNPENQGATSKSNPVVQNKPAFDHVEKTDDNRIAPPLDTGKTQAAETDAELSEEIQAQLVSLMNQLAQLLALFNSQLTQNPSAIELSGLNGVDAAALQSLLNQLQQMLQAQTGATPNGTEMLLKADQSLTVNAAATDLLNQITALMQHDFSNDTTGFNQLLGEIAAALKNLVAQDSKAQTAQPANTATVEQGAELISAGEKPAESFLSSKFVVIEASPTESSDGAVVRPDLQQKVVQSQSQISAAQLAKGAFAEGKPLNLAVIQTQLTVGASQDESSVNAVIAPLSNQNSPLPVQDQQLTQGAASANRDQLFSQIVERAKFMFANNHSEMEVNLKPDHLGKLQLKVVIENQTVTARFVAESQQVKEIIETNLNQLRDQLRQNGMQVESLTVTVGHQMNPQNFNQTANNQSGYNQLGGQSQDYSSFTEEDDQALTPSPRSIRETVIDLIA
jgi:flagellar hook-length control protein FliK